MISDFSDKDFAFVIKSIENYDKSCSELVQLAHDRNVPLHVISSLVNVQRMEYVLPVVRHDDIRDLLLDKVVSDSKYFFNSENLRLSLATLVSTHKGGTRIDFDMVKRVMEEVKRILSVKIAFTYEISEYLRTLAFFK